MKPLPFGYMTAEAGLENLYSMEFDGIDDYVEGSINGDPFKSATIRSFSFWVKTASTDTFIPLFSGIGPTATLFRYCNQLYYRGDVNKLLWSYDSTPIYGGNVCQAITTDPIVINDGTWHHIMLYVPVEGNSTRNNIINAKIYVDSVDLALTTQPGTNDIRGFQSSNPLTSIVFGAGNSGGGSSQIYLDGNIDEFAYWDNYELDNDDVLDIFNATSTGKTADLSELATPPTAWSRMGDNGRFLRKQWLLPAEANKDKSQNYSMYFDSVGTTFVLPNAALGIIPPATTELTFSIWITKKNDSGWKGLYFCEGGSNDFAVSLIGADIYFSSGAGNYGLVDFAVGSGFPLDDWYNITFFYDGTFIDGDPAIQNAGRLKSYINGASQAITFTGNIDSSLNPSHAWSSIGTYSNGAPGYYGFEGLMSGLAIWKSNQIANIAEIYGGGTPPDLTDLNPDNWWKLGDESRLHDGPFFCAEQKNVNKVGNYSFGSSLITGANIAISGNPASLQITAAPLSISYWVYNNYESGGSSYLFVKGDNQTTQDYSLLQSSTTASFVIRSGGTAYTVTGTTSTQDGWHHILGVYDGGDLKIYVDGNLENTNTIGSLSIDNIQTTSGIMSDGVNLICRGNHATAAIYNTDQSSNAVALFNLGEPVDESTYSPVAYWRADKSIYNTVGSNWDLPDQIGSADAVASFGASGSGNFNLSGLSPNGNNNTLSQNTVATYRAGSAPNSKGNVVSYNMEETDRKEDTPA